MNTLKNLLLTKSIAATVFAMGAVTAPAISHASPNDGMICRGSYTAHFSGTTMTCTKDVRASIGPVCTQNTRFPIKVVRAPGAPGDTSGGKDICTRVGINIGTTDSLTGLVLNQDFIFAAIDATQVAAKAKAIEVAEERSLSLPDDQVDAKTSTPTVVVNGGFGSDDIANFTVTLFTFPITAPSLRPILPNLPSLPNVSFATRP